MNGIKCRLGVYGPAGWVEGEMVIDAQALMLAADRKGAICGAMIPMIENVADTYLGKMTTTKSGIILES